MSVMEVLTLLLVIFAALSYTDKEPLVFQVALSYIFTVFYVIFRNI